MATKKYQARITCRGAIPFLVSDSIGIEKYNKLQNGEVVSLSDNLPAGVSEYLEIVKVEPKKTTPKKKKEKK